MTDRRSDKPARKPRTRRRTIRRLRPGEVLIIEVPKRWTIKTVLPAESRVVIQRKGE